MGRVVHFEIPVDDPARAQAFYTEVFGWQFAGVDDSLERAEAAGAEHVHGKQPIPGIGWSAYVRDPEGNVIGLFQPDEQAPAR